ncbi:putative transcription factor bZIP family [Helianthus anomalus]
MRQALRKRWVHIIVLEGISECLGYKAETECEELQARVETLNNDNHSLRDELQRLSEEFGKLTAENDSIKDELTRFFGPEAVSKLDAHLQSRTNEGES